MGVSKGMKWWMLGAGILSMSIALAGCGPNDRLRDNYMGKPKPEEYKPIKRDEYGNPIIPGQPRNDKPVQRDENGDPILN